MFKSWNRNRKLSVRYSNHLPWTHPYYFKSCLHGFFPILLVKIFFILLVLSFFHVHVHGQIPKYNLIRTLKLCILNYCNRTVLQLPYSVFILEFFCQNLRKFSSIIVRGHTHISFRSFVPFLVVYWLVTSIIDWQMAAEAFSPWCFRSSIFTSPQGVS